MARKKRNGTNVPIEKSGSLTYKAGLYRRLSDEDKADMEDNSIENQSKICLDYLKDKEDIHLISTYTDNGFTGTNFNRAGFIEMMNDIEAGKINCIIVKDLSRLGREYIEASELVERFFPANGIRFIAVNNHYDSINAGTTNGGIAIPITNIANDYYSKDTSRKIRGAIQAKIVCGEFMPSSGSVPYGYLRGENCFEVDEETRDIIIRIYKLRNEGMAFNAIARRLNEEMIASPGKLRYLRGLTKAPKYENAVWDRKTVRKILNDPVYLGHRIHGKVRREKLGAPKKKTDPSTWQYAYHVHEPIIEQELYDDVQKVNALELEQRGTYKSSGRLEEDYRDILLKKLYCGDCKRKMSSLKRNQRSTSKLPPVINYQCSQYLRYNGLNDCFNHYIPETVVIENIKNALNIRLSLALEAEQMIQAVERNQKKTGEKRTLSNLQLKLKECERKKERLWEDYANQLLDREEYLFAKGKYDQEYQLLLKEEEKAISDLDKEAATISAASSWVLHMKKFNKMKKLDKQLISVFVDKIYVYGDRRVEIVMNFKEDTLWELYNKVVSEGVEQYAG